MASLEDLSKNAVPPADNTAQQKGPTVYQPGADSDNIPIIPEEKPAVKEVDPRSLGEKEVVPPSIMDKLYADLDKAIERDKKEMWENVIAPAKEAMENNIQNAAAFGEGGEDAYFDGEIGSDVIPSTDQQSNIITIPQVPKLNEETTAIAEETDTEDDFLSDDSIYEDIKEEATNMENTTSQANFVDAVTPVTTAQPIQTAKEEVSAKDVAKTYTVKQSEMAADPVAAGTANVMPESNEYKFDDKFIDEAFGDDDNEISTGEVDDEDMNAMRQFVKSEIKPVNKVVDLASFRISSKPISAGRVMTAINTNLPTAKWILPATGKSIIMSALLGTEIDVLANRREGQTDLMRNQEIVQTFYKHVVGDKPATWEAWAKTILYDDFSHLYFAEYIACFNNASFAPFECDKDKHSFMQKVNIMDMVKYKNDEAKALVEKLLNTDPKNEEITSELRQVSDNIVIAFRKPTVWNVMFEDYYLPEKVRREMTDMVAIFRHIENIFVIDRQNGELRPVDTKPVGGDMTKTLKNRFKIYYDVLKSLTPDQLNAITPIMADLHKEIDYVEYQYPEVTCPKCGNVIKSNITAPIDILFIRHRLQTILV